MVEKDVKNILGVMSGTSLDGLDLALCSFVKKGAMFEYEIFKTQTIIYPTLFKQKLENAHTLNSYEFIVFHKEYGAYIGEMINLFLSESNIIPDYISSHGHTIFHQPQNGVTFQIGDGAAISAATGIDVIADFRNLDVCLGGQGAPLVPVGDMLLFSDYNYCLNIGGFANVSFENDGKRLAYDICPANIMLNRIAKLFGRDFDKDGDIGRTGKVNNELLRKLNSLPYYSLPEPKSLGREWVDEFVYPLLGNDLSNEDIMRSLYEHISDQIASQLITEKGKVLVTGGGALNTFLMELIISKSTPRIVIPNKELVDFKEALIFAFMGYLYTKKQVNCLSSVTGAKHDNIGGAMYCGKIISAKEVVS